MCEFKSAIVVRDEREKIGCRVLWSAWTESHEDLVRIFHLKDTRLNFARIEFKPDTLANAHLVQEYKLRIDEARTPDWFDGEMQARVVERLSNYIESIIVTGEVDLLIGGQFVVAGNARVSSVKTCVINVLAGSAQIGIVWGSAQIGTVTDSANIGTVAGSAKIDYVAGSAHIDYVAGSAKIGTVTDSAKIDYVRNSAHIDYVAGSAKIGTVTDSAQIDYVTDSAKIGIVWGSAKIGTVRDSATIVNDHRVK